MTHKELRKKAGGKTEDDIMELKGTPLKDTPWYRRWLEGDEEAWESLVENYSPVVYHFCYQFTQRQSLAEEYTQEVFLKLYRNLPLLAHHTNIQLWLLRTAYHYCVDQHRRTRHELKYIRDLWMDLKEKWRKNTQEQHAVFKDCRKILRKAVNSLPENLRTVIIMREYLEMTYEEMAETLQIPVGTVKSRLNRARQVLAENIHEVIHKYHLEGTSWLVQTLVNKI